jgi:hypothetical protein
VPTLLLSYTLLSYSYFYERVLVTQTRSPPHPSPVYFGYPNTLIPHSFATQTRSPPRPFPTYFGYPNTLISHSFAAPSLPHPARSSVWVGLLFDFATYVFFRSARCDPVFSSMLSLATQIPRARLLHNSSHPQRILVTQIRSSFIHLRHHHCLIPRTHPSGLFS